MTLGELNIWASITLQGALVLVLGIFLWRFRMQAPWIGALFLYFLVREIIGIQRVIGIPPGPPPQFSSWDAAINGLSAFLLAVLIFTSGRMIRGIQSMRDAAGLREREYERARRDYHQLVRHRLFNPLTVIEGAALTLEAGVVHPDIERRLIEAIQESADAIRHTTLEPERRSEEETSLDAVPRIDKRSSVPATSDRRRTHGPRAWATDSAASGVAHSA